MKMKGIATAALIVLGIGMLGTAQAQRYGNYGGYGDRYRYNESRYSGIPQGTEVDVRIDNTISTDDVRQGDTWTGSVAQSVTDPDGRVVIPAGTRVTGVVAEVAEGTHQSPAQLGLALRRAELPDGVMRLRADAEPIVAGSQRARKIGAIAGGAAVGALLGHAVGEHSHGALIGGLLGGAAGYGVTRHALRTLVLKPGTVVSFTTRDYVATR